ncbi:MAG: efflux RND transporter permease subunit [Caulobacteraceae bacterium]
MVQFDLSRNIDAAAQDVQTAVNAAAGQLPGNLPNAPTIKKVNPAETPMIVLGMTSDTLPITTVSDYATTSWRSRSPASMGSADRPAVRPAQAGHPHPHRSAQGGDDGPAGRFDPRHADRQHRQRAQGFGHRPEDRRDRLRQRSAQRRQGLERPDRRLYAWARRSGERDLGEAVAADENNQGGCLAVSGQGQRRPDGLQRPGRDAGRVQAARRQHHQDRAAGEGGAAAAAGQHSAGDQTDRAGGTGPRPSRPRWKDVEITMLITIFLVVGVIFIFCATSAPP